MCLEDQKVEHIFGYPGGAVLPIYDELKNHPTIKHILVRHEQGAGHAAEGYARSTGKPGVVLVTSGPGATNVVTALTDAYMDSVPLVCISGQVPTHLIGTDAFQECDTTGITRPCTKHNWLVKDINDLPRIMHEAFEVATTGRPGPVLVDIPKDIQFAKAKYFKPKKEKKLNGKDLIRGIATSYEIQLRLSMSIALNPNKIDHVGHLGPAITGGIGAMLNLDDETIYQAIQYSAHTSIFTRQGRKGNLSSWKAFAPGLVGRNAIDAIDRAIRGEKGPSPVWEGDYGIVPILLHKENEDIEINLPEKNAPRAGILSTFTKEHSAGYHGNSIIDVAFLLKEKIKDLKEIKKIINNTKTNKLQICLLYTSPSPRD